MTRQLRRVRRRPTVIHRRRRRHTRVGISESPSIRAPRRKNPWWRRPILWRHIPQASPPRTAAERDVLDPKTRPPQPRPLRKRRDAALQRGRVGRKSPSGAPDAPKMPKAVRRPARVLAVPRPYGSLGVRRHHTSTDASGARAKIQRPTKSRDRRTFRSRRQMHRFAPGKVRSGLSDHPPDARCNAGVPRHRCCTSLERPPLNGWITLRVVQIQWLGQH